MNLHTQMTEYVSADERIRPLRDLLLIRPLEWEPSKILKVIRDGRPLRGEVVAAGPGTYPKRYSPDRSKTWDSKAFRKTEVQPGDVIELGGLNIFDGQGYSFPIIMHGTERLLMCQEQDVCGVRHGSAD